MKSTAHQFPANAPVALLDDQLRLALSRAQGGFVTNRAKAVDALPEFEALRAAAQEAKEHTLSHLDYYLELFERQATAAGSQVHWAATPEQARRIVLTICKDAQANTVTKGKSMVGEEIAVNEALEGAGLDVIETGVISI